MTHHQTQTHLELLSDGRQLPEQPKQLVPQCRLSGPPILHHAAELAGPPRGEQEEDEAQQVL